MTLVLAPPTTFSHSPAKRPGGAKRVDKESTKDFPELCSIITVTAFHIVVGVDH